MNRIIVVTGQRDWRDRETIYRVLDEELVHALAHHVDPGPWKEFTAEERATFILRHGVAEGADWIANDWGKERGVTIERFPAAWKDPVTGAYNAGAGPIRNRAMAQVEPRADKICAFWNGKMRIKYGKREYSGTLDMIQVGLEAGIPVRVTPPTKEQP